MAAIKEIISATNHRPWNLPEGSWRYYQEWNNAIFFYWQVPEEILRPLVPEALQIDTFEGTAWVSVVAFTMQKIRPRYLPSIRLISDFHEINLRTYVTHEGISGVYFLNIEAQKRLSAWISRKISGLPYEKSVISSIPGQYKSSNHLKKLELLATFKLTETISDKKAVDLWLTERYCLYMDREDRLFRYDIHHLEWKIRGISFSRLELKYHIKNLKLDHDTADLIHYSDGVQVLAWPKQEIY